VGTPRPWLGLAVGGLLVLGYGLDAADGQLARLRGGGSAQGEWLDHVVDCVKNASIHLAVLVSWYRQDEPSGLLLVPLAFSLCASTWFFALLLTEKLRPASAGSNKTDPDVERPPLLRSLVVLPADYGLLCVVFVLIGWPAVFTPVYVLLAAANLLLLAAGLRRWFVELTPAKALS
jgi:phosphatidylglycerophosphate synthase